MKLEVGKTYKNGFGEEVKKVADLDYPYVDAGGRHYTEKGIWLLNTPTPKDLVK